VPRLSIVIPVWGKLEQLEETLLSVLENQPDDSEIVVVLDQAYADPYNLKDEIRFVEAPRGAGLAAAINQGVLVSRAPIVHLLLCGARVGEGWCDAALARFDDPSVAAVAPVLVDQDRPATILAAGVSYGVGGRIRLLGRGRPAASATAYQRRIQSPHLVAGFYRQSALSSVSLFSAEVGEHLTVLDLALSLQQAGLRTVLEPRCQVLAAAGADCRVGPFRRSLELERFFWRFFPRGGWLTALVCHAMVVLGESLVGIPRLAMPAHSAGRLLGMLRIGSHGQNRRRLQRLQPKGETSAALAAPHFGETSSLRIDRPLDAAKWR
jgi:GT2 family glycosyltransferase